MTTNNRMELLAVIVALETLTKKACTSWCIQTASMW